MEKEIDDDWLVASAKAGNGDAFGELFGRHFGRVLRTTQSMTRHREDAEDAAQDSFASAFAHVKSFDGRCRFSTWLTEIAIRASLMKLWKRRMLREAPLEEPGDRAGTTRHFEHADAAPNPEELYAEGERRTILREAVAKLRPKLREIVEVHQFAEKSVQETAAFLNLSTPAAKARMFHARAALRKAPQMMACDRNGGMSLDFPGLGAAPRRSLHAAKTRGELVTTL